MANLPINQQEPVTSLQEQYINILREKGWMRLPKFSLMNFYREMKNLPFDKRETLIAHALKIRPTSIESDAKIAYHIFWKAQLFKIGHESPDNKIKLLECHDFLDKIDKAMLARLITACHEQHIGIDIITIANLLYQDYEPNQLSVIIEKLQIDTHKATLVVSEN